MKRKILFKCFDNNTISLAVQDNKCKVFQTLATFNGNSIHCDGIDVLKNEPVPDSIADYWHVEMYDFGNAVCVFDLDTDKYDKPLIRRNCLSPETIAKLREEVESPRSTFDLKELKAKIKINPDYDRFTEPEQIKKLEDEFQNANPRDKENKYDV